MKERLITIGACAVGIATSQMLQGGPPSVELRYALPDANAEGAFGLSLDLGLLQDKPGPMGEKWGTEQRGLPQP